MTLDPVIEVRSSGDRVTVNVLALPGLDAGLARIINETEVSYGYACGNGSSIGVAPYTLTESGTWAVRLVIDTTATGSSKLRVSRPA